MSLLTVIQNASKELGLTTPSTAYANTDPIVVQMVALANRAGKQVRDLYYWPQLLREATVTLIDATASYSLPTDFNTAVMETHWDQAGDLAMLGPLSPGEWQAWQQGITPAPNRSMYRIKGFGANKINLIPTPTAAEAGNTLLYEYQSTFWLTTVAGATPTLEAFTADTNVIFFREDLLELDIIWRWRRAKRLDYGAEMAESVVAWRSEATAKQGAPTIDLANRGGARFLGPDNVPDRHSWYT